MNKIFKSLLILIIMCFVTINVNAQKSDAITKNGKNQITKIVKYHSNDKIKQIITYSYYSNNKKRVTTNKTYSSTGKATYNYYRSNYSNGYAKYVRIYSNYYNGYYRKRVTTSYRTNKKKSYREYVNRNSKGVRTSVYKYYYNKIGQLKSNKYGNAYRKNYTYFSNGKIAKYYKYKYKSTGKLSRTYYKYYSSNKPKPAPKPKPTCATYIAYDGWCVDKGYDDNKNGIKDEWEPYIYYSETEAEAEAQRMVNEQIIWGYTLIKGKNELNGKDIWAVLPH